MTRQHIVDHLVEVLEDSSLLDEETYGIDHALDFLENKLGVVDVAFGDDVLECLKALSIMSSIQEARAKASNDPKLQRERDAKQDRTASILAELDEISSSHG